MNARAFSRHFPKAAALSCLLAGTAAADILLIEDQGGFGTLAADLRADGYTVTVRNNEFANGYANLFNAGFLDGFSLVVYGERGSGGGSSLPASVGTSLEAYLQGGGNLLVTGWDALFVDQGGVLANVVRATLPGGFVPLDPTWAVVADHPITRGPFGNFTGQTFAASSYDVPVTPNTAAGAIELVSMGSPRITGKIIFTDLPGNAGSVTYWNGGLSGTTTNAQPDFTNNGNPEAIFRNYVAMIEGPPPGFDGLAGPDVQVGDVDGDGLVTQVLDGSGATQVIGDIVSWQWSWPGGSASGEKPERTFPANNTPFTVTLTATDGVGVTHVDTFEMTVFTKLAGLFTDFADARYSGVDPSTTASRVAGTLEDDTLVIDPIGPGVPDVFRRAAGVWTVSPFTDSVTDIRAIDDTTLVSGSLATGTDFKVHRLVAGQWITSSLSLSAPPPLVSRFNYAFDPQSVVFADLFNNTYGSSGGRVFAYDWPSTGNDWNHSELIPPGGVTPSARWGEAIAVDGDLVAVIGGLGADKLKLFRKSGTTWAHEASIAPTTDPLAAISNFTGILSVGSGVVVAGGQHFPADRIVVLEKDGASWVQTVLSLDPAGPFGNSLVGVDVDDDGLSFVARDNAGNFLLYQRDPGATSWATATVTKRRLPLADLHADPYLTGATFSGGEIVVSDPVSGAVRIFDKDVPFDTVNAEPGADAGEDIATTSFDGQPVMVFLNGGATSDANYEEVLQAEWTWAGGSATGLFAFALIDPSVTSVELRITDRRGAVSRDTVAVSIDAPPVVDPGEDVIVVDSDGDGSIRVNVSATLESSDYPVSAWSWAWPGGIFSGQSGTLTLGAAANGQPVTLTAIDGNGLSSQTSFGFSMLTTNPAPVILQPTGGGPTDKYGSAVAIQNGTALIGAPKKPYSGNVTGATYLAQNLNGLWPQIQLAPGTRQGDAVLVDGDLAFVGAQDAGGGSPGFEIGQVIVYQKTNGVWQFKQTISPPSAVDAFGASLAKSGNRLLIGAPEVYGGQPRCGAAFLYEFNGVSWILSQRFDPPVEKFQGHFGTKVAIANDVIAISQPGFSDPSSVVMFEKSGGVWNFESEVFSATPSPPQFNENYHFGQGLGLSESELLIGSPVEGVVYRHTRAAGNWTANGVINPNRYFFGSSIAMKDGVAVVGSVIENVGLGGAIPGSVTSLLLKNGSWQESGYLKLTPAIDPHIVETPNYSTAVSFDGRDLIVGAPTARNSGGVQTGKSYLYRNFAGVNPDANFEPLAEAGADISVNDTVIRGPAPAYLITEPSGSEVVTLDASGSSDQENAIVSHAWSWPGGSASGVTADARFPVGTTVVTLTVTDDKGIVNSDTLNVTVALAQSPPDPLPGSDNTLTVNLPVAGAKWRLSSEFLWHASGESADDVVLGETYQLEIIGFAGSVETVTTFATVNSANAVADLSLILPLPPVAAGTVSFPETTQGFAWRLRGEAAWRDVLDDGDAIDELIEATLATGELIIDYKPVSGYATPASQLITIQPGQTLALNWNDYQRLDNFDPARTFVATNPANLGSDPYPYVGMIRTPLGRGTGTVVAERVVLTAAHLFFDSSGLQWADTQWFPRQQQGERQAPPVAPRGILYQTAYAQIVAPDSVENPVATVPADKKEADFAVLYFSGAGDWEGGSANYLQSSAARNWLTGPENKHAVGYAQRSQQYEQRGKIFGKTFNAPLSPLDSNPLPKLYETGELFGDGGASGSALFVQPQGVTGYYPAAVLLAGQDRAVYRVIDEDVGRMIEDAQDAASGNDEVLNNNFSLVTYGGSGLRALQVSIVTPAALSTARWAVKPNVGTTYSNLTPTQRVGFSNSWGSVTVSFTAVPGYVTPPSITLLNSQVPAGGVTTIGNVIYEPVSGFDLWKQARGITSDDDDRDRDGRNALIEYALNGSPDSGSDPVPIRMAAAPLQSVSAEFEVFVSSAADGIRYEVKASNTLPPANPVTLAIFTKADGTNGYKRVVDSQPRSASPRRFAWVEITHDRSLSTGP